MKKHIFYLFLGAMAITACNPMDDINDEIDADIAAMKELQAQQASQTKLDGDATSLIISDDYYSQLNTFIPEDEKEAKKVREEREENKAFLNNFFDKMELSNDVRVELFNEFNAIGAHKFFSKDEKDATVNYALQALLNRNYNASNGQLVNVKYNVLNPFQLGEKKDDYTATEADYTAAGERHANFSRDSRIISFLENKYDLSTFTKGDYVNLTYDYYNGQSHTFTKRPMVYDGETFVITDRLEKSDYTAMGFGYPNFSGEEQAHEYLVTYFNDKNIFAKDGDVIYKVVTVRKKVDGNYKSFDYMVRMEYKEDSYHVIGEVIKNSKHLVYIAEEGQSYKYKWISIPPFKFVEITDEAVTADHNYTFTNADYEMIGNGRHHNFDFEPGHHAPELDHAKFIEMIGQVLRIQFATVESGTVVEVKYMYFTNATRAKEDKIKLRMDL